MTMWCIMTSYKLNILVLLLISTATVAAQPNLYKYTDQNGAQIISATLPSDAADRGYAIVSPRGNIIEVVKPRLTENEIEALEKEKIQQALDQKAQLLAEQEKQEQIRKDRLLLKMFTSAKDIERSRDDKVQNIDTQLGITKDNLARLEAQLNNAYQAKEAHEKQNQEIPKMLQDTITDTQKQIEDNADFLKRKSQEQEQIRTQYQQLIERFNRLKTPPQKVE